MATLMGLAGKTLRNLLNKRQIKPTPVVEHSGQRSARFDYTHLRAVLLEIHPDGNVKLPETYADAIKKLRAQTE